MNHYEEDQPFTEISRWRFRLWLLILVIALVFMAYAFVYPVIEHRLRDQSTDSISALGEPMPLRDAIQLRVMEGLAGLWFAFLGATIGSFLNVVAYRMPRGKSVVVTPSSCPKCGSRIWARDNIPVLGWLLLAARCRTCHAPISARYPIVEASVGALFFLLFIVQLVSGGANIPFRELPQRAGITGIVFEAQWDLVLQYFYHTVLVSVLFAWMLIDVDRLQATWLACVVVIMILLVPPLIWPFLLPVPVGWPLAELQLADHAIAPVHSTWRGALAVSIVGGVVGAIVGTVLSRWAGWRGTNRYLSNPESCRVRFGEYTGQLGSSLAFIGIGLGWQAAVVIALIMLVLRASVALFAPTSRVGAQPATLCLLLAFVLHHIWWRDLT